MSAEPTKTQKIPKRENKINLFDFCQDELAIWLETHKQPKFRAQQIINWLYHNEVLNFAEMKNIGKQTLSLLEQYSTTSLPTITDCQVSQDGTTKWLLQLSTGQYIETVFIPEKNRGTLCISSQVGCALACSFCATGLQGLNKNLKTSEIIGQVWLARKALKSHNPNKKHPITNVVFMGMGEPLMNEPALYPALSILLDDHCFGLSKYRVTVSTSGVVPALKRLQHQSPCALAISLHAANDQLRNTLVPINKSYPLKELTAACKQYYEHDKKRHITIEYIMLRNVNDQLSHAKQLINIASQFPCKINLIPYNTVNTLPYEPSTTEQILLFQQKLKSAGFITTIRKQRGDPIAAACGQLAGIKHDRTQKTLRKELIES